MSLASLLLPLSLMGTPDPPQLAACPAELFRIARSKNANVVAYEANLVGAHQVDDREPVRAVWLMDAEDGRRDGLTLFERLFAFGFDVETASPQPGFWVILKAQRARPIRMRESEGCPRAFAIISGREAILRRIYVEASGSGLVPAVQSVSLFGVDPATGEPLKETIRVSDERLAGASAVPPEP